MPAEITLDHKDTPQERAAKVWSAMGFTQVWDDPVAKLVEALKAYRDLDREAMTLELSPLIMEARAEAVEAREAMVMARSVAREALAEAERLGLDRWPPVPVEGL